MNIHLTFTFPLDLCQTKWGYPVVVVPVVVVVVVRVVGWEYVKSVMLALRKLTCPDRL